MTTRPPTRTWWFAGLGVALAGILAAILLVGVGGGGGAAPATSPSAAVWPAGINDPTANLISLTVVPPASHKAAPEFHLTDQDGRPVSPSQFRGKVVVVSANDDQCQDLCTLLANDITLANRYLGPAASQVVWLSINANPFFPSVADVRAWTDAHGLGHQANWYFGTGTPAQLAATWKSYGIVVEQDPATRTVQHSAELFFVDPSGQERAVAEFGTASANTALFAHGLAQVAADLLPGGRAVHVGGPVTPAPTAHNATVRAEAPGFSLPRLDGGPALDLRAERGHWVVLNFWASTCTACRTELPALEEAYDYAGKVVDFVGIDETDQAGPARDMARQAGLTYPLVADRDGVVAGQEQITGLPFTVILDPEGRVTVRHPGAFTAEQLEYILATDVPSLPST